MSHPIIDFIEARLAEDHEAATASVTVVGDTWEANGSVVNVNGETKGRSVFEWTVCFDEGSPSEGQAEHIARHDPARVLREVAAKRAILAAYQPPTDEAHPGPCTDDIRADPEGLEWEDSPGPCERHVAVMMERRANPRPHIDEYVLRHLAAVWSDHPDYREEWRP